MGWGELYEFDDALSGLEELRKLVEQRTLPHLLDEAIDAYEARLVYHLARLLCDLHTF